MPPIPFEETASIGIKPISKQGTQRLVHASIGKCSLNDEDIVNNAKFFYKEILKNKPSASKGIFIKGIFISTTLGPGLKIEESSVI